MLRSLLAAALAAASVQASAGLMSGADSTVRMQGFSNGHAALDVTLDSFGTIGAGQFQGTVDGLSFLTYCTDLYQSFGWGRDYSYTLVDNGSTHGFTRTQASQLGKLYTAAGGDASTTTDSVAFQLAVWELLYDSSPASVRSGDFRLVSGGSTAQRDRADAWLATVRDPAAPSSFNAQRLFSSVAQDFIVFTPQPALRQAPPAVPEPTGLALVALALSLLVLTRRRS